VKVLGAPDTTADPVRKLCARSGPDRDPVSLPIRSGPDHDSLDCFRCVRCKLKGEGGRIQLGCAIWEWPRVFVKAEHHAVDEPVNGPPWVDITPSAFPAIRCCLFLPDNTSAYDFENEGVPGDNVHLTLSDDPLIQQFLDAAKNRLAVLNAIPGIERISADTLVATRLSAIEREQTHLVVALAMKFTSQGASCFCGSGQKFKRCHEKSHGGQR
jgi:hypothetical protein